MPLHCEHVADGFPSGVPVREIADQVQPSLQPDERDQNDLEQTDFHDVFSSGFNEQDAKSASPPRSARDGSRTGIAREPDLYSENEADELGDRQLQRCVTE